MDTVRLHYFHTSACFHSGDMYPNHPLATLKTLTCAKDTCLCDSNQTHTYPNAFLIFFSILPGPSLTTVLSESAGTEVAGLFCPFAFPMPTWFLFSRWYFKPPLGEEKPEKEGLKETKQTLQASAVKASAYWPLMARVSEPFGQLEGMPTVCQGLLKSCSWHYPAWVRPPWSRAALTFLPH